MSGNQIIEIECPICPGHHKYRLEVIRTEVMGALPTSTPPDFHPVSIRRFTRLFSCPVKNENFQATIKLEETGSNPIETVRVVGVIIEGMQE